MSAHIQNLSLNCSGMQSAISMDVKDNDHKAMIKIKTDPTILTINSKSNVIFKIHENGTFEYNGTPDEAAELFLDSINVEMNKRNFNERLAVEGLYDKLISMLPTMANMSKEQIISYIEDMKTEAHKALTWAILSDSNKE
jgi:hypothetical protein